MVRFCPRCHRPIVVPAFLASGNVKVEGQVTIVCGNCKKGQITLAPTEV